MNEKCFCHLNGYAVKDATARKSIEDVTKSIEDVTKSIEELEENVIKTVEDIENSIEETINRERKYIFLTDSYGNRYNENNKNWIALLCEYCGIKSENHFDIAVDGSCFVREGSLSWLTILQNANIADKESYTDLIICGGANDMLFTYEEVSLAIDNFMNYVKAEFPNINVSLACVGVKLVSADMKQRLTGSLRAYREIIKHGASYIVNSEYVMCDTSLLESDKCHPNAKGVEAIAFAMINAIKKGYCDVHYNAVANLTIGSTETHQGTELNDQHKRTFIKLDNENVSIICGRGGILAEIELNTPVSLYPFKVEHNVLNFDRFFVAGNDSADLTFYGFARCTTDTEIIPIPCIFYIGAYDDGKVSIGVTYLNTTGVSGIKKVQYYIGTVSLPTDF